MAIPRDPETFEQAVAQYLRSLSGYHYPFSENLIWVEPADLLLSLEGAICVKLPVPAENLARARERFEHGMKSGLGVLFGTLCDLPNATCCYAWVPKDKAEQKSHLIPRGLKTVVPTYSFRKQGKAVKNRFYWRFLKHRYQKNSGRIQDLFG